MPTDDNHFRRLRLNLATEIEPIQGQLIDDRGKVWPFMGWLDLVQVLEATLDRTRTASERDSRQHRAAT